MPQVKPGSGGGDDGLVVQTIKLAAAPTAPYTLTAVVPLAPEAFTQYLAVRTAEDGGGNPTDWAYTETERIARIHGIDYFEIKARIPSGAATSYKLDRLDSPHHGAIPLQRTNYDGVSTPGIASFINRTAWGIIDTPGLIRLEIRGVLPGGQYLTQTVSLTGGFLNPPGSEDFGLGNRIFASLAATSGWYRRGRLIRTLYKHIRIGNGELGWLHVFGTVMAETPEIQWHISLHNGGIQDPASPSTFTPVQDILIDRVRILGLGELPAVPNFSGAWTWAGELQDGGSGNADSIMRVAQNELVAPCSDTDPNRLHVIPPTWERPFRFACFPSSVTPYGKHAIGMADWGKSLGGWAFSSLGLPDYTALGAAAASMSLNAEGDSAKTKLRTLAQWKGDESGNQGGLFPVTPMWPASWDTYGGSTAGTGMYPHYGCKQAWTAERKGLELLMVDQLRARSRNYGCLYYDMSGIPALATRHAPGGVAPWKRFDRRFLKEGGVPKDMPFLVTRQLRRVHEADYNPGPADANSSTPIDSPSEAPNGNRPDWYLPGEDVPGVAMDTLVTGPLVLAHFDQSLGHVPPPPDLVNILGANSPDLAVPVVFQINGATTYNNTKTVVFRIVGTGELDIEVTEDVTFTGPASGATALQARYSAGKFKTITSIAVQSIAGVLVATELLSIGRASVGVADYWGTSGITALDDQHAIRYHATNRSLFLLANDPIAFVYLMMDAASMRMTYWELDGPAKRLGLVENGGPGHGNNMARNFAWAIDCVATGLALSEAIVPHEAVDLFWNSWRERLIANISNSRMVANGLFQAPNSFKEWQSIPWSSQSEVNEGSSSQKFFHGVASRETSYFLHSLLMLSSVYGHDDPTFRVLIKGMAAGFQNLLWKVSGGTAQGPHAYVACAYRSEPAQTVHPRTGALWNRILMENQGVNSTDVWTIFADQAALPEENPLSKALINPASYPTPDADRFVPDDGVGLAGNTITNGTPLTLANTTVNAAQQPAPIDLKITGATTFTNGKRRTFKVTGTDPWGVPIDDDCLTAERTGDLIFPAYSFTILAHTFPVATQIALTVLGGRTFVKAQGSNPEGRMIFRVVGQAWVAENTLGTVTEDMICDGRGTQKQVFRSINYFKSITSITVTQVGGIGGSAIREATEKWRWGTPQTYLVATGNSAATQTFKLETHHKTVTEIVSLTDAQATDHGFNNLGTLVAGEKFNFGFPNVGLRTQVPIMNPDNYQTGYGLAVFKLLAATEADELIKRYANVDGSQGGADTLVAAKNEIKTWTEYGPDNGPDRLEQWAPLLWTLRDVT